MERSDLKDKYSGKPVLWVDEAKCRANIARMADRAIKSGAVLRPHFKTHQSKIIGSWFRDYGIQKITVSSISMARYFADDGWDDILIAIPVNILELKEINDLSRKVKLSVLLDSIEGANAIDARAEARIDVWVEIDTGQHRTGVPSDAFDEIESLLKTIRHSGKMNFLGFYSHAGHTYLTADPQSVFLNARNQMDFLKEQFSAYHPLCSMGDTPGASLSGDLGGLDQLTPGNFVFYDLMQWATGSCRLEDIAVYMSCPVISVRGNKAVVYGGAIHFSKDQMAGKEGKNIYGVAFKNEGEKIKKQGNLISLSQEHGVINLNEPTFKIGDLANILPVHSCLTAQAMGKYRESNSRKLLDHLASY